LGGQAGFRAVRGKAGAWAADGAGAKSGNFSLGAAGFCSPGVRSSAKATGLALFRRMARLPKVRVDQIAG
jgi:hypothetical protein